MSAAATADAPFHDYAFYPSGHQYNLLRSRQKITRMIEEIAEPLMSISKKLKRQYVLEHLIAKIPQDCRVCYDPQTNTLVPIDDNDAATKIVQKLRDKKKNSVGPVPFRNYAFYPADRKYNAIRTQQTTMRNFLMARRIAYQHPSELNHHIRHVIVPELCGTKQVFVFGPNQGFRPCSEAVAFKRLQPMMLALPTVMIEPTITHKRRLPKTTHKVTPVKRPRRNERPTLVASKEQNSNVVDKEPVFDYVMEDMIVKRLSGTKEANGDHSDETSVNDKSKSAHEDCRDATHPPKQVVTDCSKEMEQMIVKAVNETQVPFHDCAFYPKGTEYDLLRPFQAMTKFIDAHRPFMAKSAKMRTYARLHLVQPLLAVGACLYEPKKKEFFALDAQRVEARVVRIVQEERKERMSQQQRQLYVELLKKTEVSTDGEDCSPPSQINLERTKEKQVIVDEIEARHNIPFNDVAFYPPGTCYNDIRSIQAVTAFLNEHHDELILAPKAAKYITAKIMPALMQAKVCIYDSTTRNFTPCLYRQAELRILQKVRDRKKALRENKAMPC